MDKITLKEFYLIIENVLINAPKPSGNKFCIQLDDVDIIELYEYFALWPFNLDEAIVIGENQFIIMVNGEKLTDKIVSFNLKNKQCHKN